MPKPPRLLVATLCFSRYGYIEFSLSQKKADFYRALVHALEAFGGSPKKIIFDNLKAAVLNGSGRYAVLIGKTGRGKSHRNASELSSKRFWSAAWMWFAENRLNLGADKRSLASARHETAPARDRPV